MIPAQGVFDALLFFEEFTAPLFVLKVGEK